jgi:hypothetical protein
VDASFAVVVNMRVCATAGPRPIPVLREARQGPLPRDAARVAAVDPDMRPELPVFIRARHGPGASDSDAIAFCT